MLTSLIEKLHDMKKKNASYILGDIKCVYIVRLNVAMSFCK